MLGLIRGRVYYNLLNWYRLLALLPGFTVNRRFMEQMMGVKEGLPERVAAELVQRELASAVWPTAFASSERRRPGPPPFHAAAKRFAASTNGSTRRSARAVQTSRCCGPMSCPHITAIWKGSLLTRWDAPLINDFLAMIFYGVLGKLTRKWCGDGDGTLSKRPASAARAA